MNEFFDETAASIQGDEPVVESVSPAPVQPRPAQNFGMRFLAFVIDALILGGVLAVLSYFLLIVAFAASAPKDIWNSSMRAGSSPAHRYPAPVYRDRAQPSGIPSGAYSPSGQVSQAESEKFETTMGVTVLVIGGIDLILILLYDVLMTMFAGGSVGKLATGAKVVDLNGNRIGFGKSLGRAAVKMLTALLSCHLLLFVAAFTGRNRALHDFAAGTEVVSSR